MKTLTLIFGPPGSNKMITGKALAVATSATLFNVADANELNECVSGFMDSETTSLVIVCKGLTTSPIEELAHTFSGNNNLRIYTLEADTSAS